jgi:hypothetical protein
VRCRAGGCCRCVQGKLAAGLAEAGRGDAERASALRAERADAAMAAHEGSWAEVERRCVGVERERGAAGPGEEWRCMGDARARRSRLSSIDQAGFSRSMGRL